MSAVADCGGRFFDNCHGQSVKNGSAMANMAMPCGVFWISVINNTARQKDSHHTHTPMMTSVVNCKQREITVCSNSTTQSAVMLM
jgi:hypothetical protein